ncbi:MAG: Gfo/Idh/MocA family oxidoreductase, partial [Caldimonas sp.]
LKRAMDAGRFGRIYMVNVNVFWTRPQEYYDSAAWRGTWEFDGGAFMNQASHYIDLLDWIGGPVESVMAYTGTLARNIEVEDTGVAALKWRNGAMGSINVTMLTYPKNLEGSITLIGERGTVRVGGTAANRIEHWTFDSAHEHDELVASASYDLEGVYGPGHMLFYNNVIATLRGEAKAQVDGNEGLRSLELLIAAYRSASNGVRVSLPLSP